MSVQKNHLRNFTHSAAVKAFSAFLLAVLIISQPFAHTFADQEETSGQEPSAPAVDPFEENAEYSAVLYNNTNGLPTSEANDIAQTSDGFIWIGSYSGLIRYDGNNFERVDASTGITSVKALYVDSRDRLWIGTNDSGLALLENNELKRWTKADGLGSDSIQGIVEAEQDMIYVTTTSGIALIDAPMHVHPMSDSRIGEAYLHGLRRGSDGTVYGLTNYGDVFTIKGGMVNFYLSHEDSFVKGVTCIYPDPLENGYVYVETEDSKIYRGDLKAGLENAEEIDIAPLNQVQSFEYIDGKLWVCARNGLGILDKNGFQLLENVPLNNSIGRVMKDYEGNLWFTSTRQGVMKIVPNRFTDVSNKYGLPELVVNSTCMYDDMLFVGSDTGLYVLAGGKSLDSLPLEKAVTASGEELEYDDLIDMLYDCRIRSIIRDSKDRLWIATWRKYGLLRYDHGVLTAFNTADGLFSDHIRAVCECKDGSILVAGTGGVNVIEGDKVTAGYGEKADIANTEILTVAEGTNGDIIAGSDGDGIYIIGERGTKHIGTEQGLTSGAVMRVKFDDVNNVYWIITGSCIAYMTPDYQLTVVSNFPYSNNFDIYRSDKGDMWILSSNGIYVTSPEELLENGEIDPEYYGMSNGLPCITTANSYSELTDDGDLFISGSTGIAKVNIEAPYESLNDLKIAVPFLEADGEYIYPNEDGGFRIPSGVKKITIYSYVFSYSLTDPLVSYRLDGFDTKNTTVRRSDLQPHDYTNLSGGSYNFIIEVRSLDETESKGIIVSIVKDKAFYEQPWFYILTGLGAVLLFILASMLYTRRRLKKLEQKHREEAEKERISTELHTATRIQESMMPHTFPPFPDKTQFDIYASMDPAREVGGDFYDYFLIDDDHLGIVIADVSGKGIPAALFMMVSKVILQSCAMLGRSPGDILTKTNDAICSNNQAEMFITVWLGILEISTGKLTAANAGHEYPVIAGPGGKFEILKDKHGLVIGGMEGITYREYEMQLEPGSKIFVYTDGVPEATASDNSMFGLERLTESLNREPGASPEQLLKNVREDVDAFVKEAEQFDDLTMLCLEYKG